MEKNKLSQFNLYSGLIFLESVFAFKENFTIFHTSVQKEVFSSTANVLTQSLFTSIV